MECKFENFTTHKIESSYGIFEIKYTYKDDFGGSRTNSYGWLSTSPTANCQLFSLAQANNFFANVKGVDLIKTLQLIGKTAGAKQIMLIDVNQSYFNKVEELFKPENVIIKTPYLSTNGSNMCIYLLRMKFIYDYKDPIVEPVKTETNESYVKN